MNNVPISNEVFQETQISQKKKMPLKLLFYHKINQTLLKLH